MDKFASAYKDILNLLQLCEEYLDERECELRGNPDDESATDATLDLREMLFNLYLSLTSLRRSDLEEMLEEFRRKPLIKTAISRSGPQVVLELADRKRLGGEYLWGISRMVALAREELAKADEDSKIGDEFAIRKYAVLCAEWANLLRECGVSDEAMVHHGAKK